MANLPLDVMKKVKDIRLHPSPDSLNDLLSTSQWEEIKKNLLNTSSTMGKWILQYITDISGFLSQITAFCDKKKKKIELHLQAKRDLLTLLFTFNHHNNSRYYTTQRSEVTINREVKVRGGPMRGGCSTSFDAENDFVLNSHILAELRKEFKNKMRLTTASTHKEATYEEMQRHEGQMQSLKKSKNRCQSLPWSSKKYGNRSGGARKFCLKRIHRKTISIS